LAIITNQLTKRGGECASYESDKLKNRVRWTGKKGRQEGGTSKKNPSGGLRNRESKESKGGWRGREDKEWTFSNALEPPTSQPRRVEGRGTMQKNREKRTATIGKKQVATREIHWIPVHKLTLTGVEKGNSRKSPKSAKTSSRHSDGESWSLRQTLPNLNQKKEGQNGEKASTKERQQTL